MKCHGEDAQNVTLIQLLQLPELLLWLAGTPDASPTDGGMVGLLCTWAGQQRCHQGLSQRGIPGTSHTPHLPNHFTP